MIFAQSSDALSGGSGWAGAGILGLVLCWLLLRHLPAKDAQLKELLVSHQASLDAKDRAHETTTKEIIANAVAREKERREEFKENLLSVIAHCERNEVRMTEVLKASLADVNKNLVELRNVLVGQMKTGDMV